MMKKIESLYLWVIVLTAIVGIVGVFGSVINFSASKNILPGAQLPGGTCSYTGCEPRIIYTSITQLFFSIPLVRIGSLLLAILGGVVLLKYKNLSRKLITGFVIFTELWCGLLILGWAFVKIVNPI